MKQRSGCAKAAARLKCWAAKYGGADPWAAEASFEDVFWAANVLWFRSHNPLAVRNDFAFGQAASEAKATTAVPPFPKRSHPNRPEPFIQAILTWGL